MQRLFSLLVLISLTQISFAQAGIYKSSTDFKDSNVYLVGDLNQFSENKLCFIWKYAQIEYEAREIWGFRDTLDNDYRSINHQFYKIENHGPVWLYSFAGDDGTIHLISSGINGEVVELNAKNLEEVLAANEDLLSEFRKLKKSEKEDYLTDYLARLNLYLEKEELSMKE